MRWCDLAFVHYEIAPETLRKHLPDGLEPDIFGGSCWVGLVPFHMKGVAPRGFPTVRALSNFPEINVRTYVVRDGKPGVWFFSLDVPCRHAVWGARSFFHLPYFRADMTCRRERGYIEYESIRGNLRFRGRYRGLGRVEVTSGSFESWATERYCLYSGNRRGQIFRAEVQHPPWPLERAEIEIDCRTLLGDLPVGSQHPTVLYSRELPVVAWPLQRC